MWPLCFSSSTSTISPDALPASQCLAFSVSRLSSTILLWFSEEVAFREVGLPKTEPKTTKYVIRHFHSNSLTCELRIYFTCYSVHLFSRKCRQYGRWLDCTLWEPRTRRIEGTFLNFIPPPVEIPSDPQMCVPALKKVTTAYFSQQKLIWARHGQHTLRQRYALHLVVWFTKVL